MSLQFLTFTLPYTSLLSYLFSYISPSFNSLTVSRLLMSESGCFWKERCYHRLGGSALQHIYWQETQEINNRIMCPICPVRQRYLPLFAFFPSVKRKTKGHAGTWNKGFQIKASAAVCFTLQDPGKTHSDVFCAKNPAFWNQEFPEIGTET